jgi:hypothetical protein
MQTMRHQIAITQASQLEMLYPEGGHASKLALRAPSRKPHSQEQGVSLHGSSIKDVCFDNYTPTRQGLIGWINLFKLTLVYVARTIRIFLAIIFNNFAI